MVKLDEDSKDILLGTLIVGVLGICAAALYFSTREKGRETEAKTSLSSMGRIIMQVGELLSSPDVSHAPFVKDVEKKMHKHESAISDVLELISVGVHLWEKIRKGG